jgi:non-specific serine/threonine protein kinase
VTQAGREQAGRRAGKIVAPLASLVGREPDITEVIRLLAEYRLVTVTGPGGVGKTRLATEVARRVAGQFPDGAWFIELASVADGAQVAAEVTSTLGIQQDPGRPAVEVLAEALTPRRLLLILDNCEHLLPAVADLCAALLSSADDVSVLATSREQMGMSGETRYRLPPLGLPDSAEPGAVSKSAAAELFIDRARQADPRFTLSAQAAPLVARVVTRLDGMPLAIELAAARVEALGLVTLADRIDDALRLLTGGDRLAADRHRSLAAVADWSYRLLAGPEQRVFRLLAVFPGPFTLEAAQAVAGPDAGPVVLRLVDCSLLVPPRPGADQRFRYTMLQTLRAYGLTRLREASEEGQAWTALAAFAGSMAEQAAAGLATSDDRELDAVRWLDAEDATLTWALEHDPDGALRLATTLFPWLRLRGRLAEAQMRLNSAVGRSAATDESWAGAQVWLGYLSADFDDISRSIGHYTAVVEAHREREPSPALAMALTGLAIGRLNQGDTPGAVRDARRALTLARDRGDAPNELLALACLSVIACYAGDAAQALEWALLTQNLLSPVMPGWVARWCYYVLALALTEIGELDSARRLCTVGLTLARQVDDLMNLCQLLGEMGDLERLAGNLADAGVHLREGVAIATRIGHRLSVANFIEQCGYLCAAAGRWADAVTLWAAFSADQERRGRPDGAVFDARRAQYRPRIEEALDPAQLREAQERGTRMTVSAAAELAIVVANSAQDRDAGAPAPRQLLSPRERELVTLVAQGHTNAQIAGRLYISVRTVSSHLDRIRDKTGCRRRADLTRLAVEESLV